jgi:hypothetical protein
MTADDTLWQEALERYFPAFMAFFFPLTFAHIAWEKGYEFLDDALQQALRDAAPGCRPADKLARVVGKSGCGSLILIHIKAERRPAADFTEHMAVSNSRLFDRYGMPVVNLVIWGDTRAWRRPEQFLAQITAQTGDGGLPVPRRPIGLLDYRARWALLEQATNPVAILVQAYLKARETAQDPEDRYYWKLQLMQGLRERGYQRNDLLALQGFIDRILRLPEDLENRLRQALRVREAQWNTA